MSISDMGVEGSGGTTGTLHPCQVWTAAAADTFLSLSVTRAATIAFTVVLGGRGRPVVHIVSSTTCPSVNACKRCIGLLLGRDYYAGYLLYSLLEEFGGVGWGECFQWDPHP